MAVDVLLIDENGNESTKTYTQSELDLIIKNINGSCRMLSLPPDEGLNKDNCYTLHVKIG